MKWSGKDAQAEFFPTPYPDECFYSIFCRYCVRSGITSPKAATEIFFGCERSLLASTVYFPRKLERLSYWVSPDSGITGKTDLRTYSLPLPLHLTYQRCVSTDGGCDPGWHPGRRHSQPGAQDDKQKQICICGVVSPLLPRMCQGGHKEIWGGLLAQAAPAPRCEVLPETWLRH